MLFKRIVSFIVIIVMLYVQVIGYSYLGIGYAFARVVSYSDDGGGDGSSGGTDGGGVGSGSDSGGNGGGGESSSGSDSSDGNSGSNSAGNNDKETGTVIMSNTVETTVDSNGNKWKDFDYRDDVNSSGSKSNTSTGSQSQSTHWSEGRGGRDGNEISSDSSSRNSSSNSEPPQRAIDNSKVNDIGTFTENPGYNSGDVVDVVVNGERIQGTVERVLHYDEGGTYTVLKKGWTKTPITTNEQSNSTSSSSNGVGALTEEAANIYSEGNSSSNEPSTDIEPGIVASYAPVYKVDEFRERINSEFTKIKEIADSTVGPNSIDALNALNNSLAEANTNHNQITKAILDILPKADANNTHST